MPNRRATTQARQDQSIEEHFPVQTHSIHNMDEEYDPELSMGEADGFGRTLSFLWGLKVRPRHGVVYDVPEDHYLVISMASLGAADPKGKRSALLIEDAGLPDDYEEEDDDDDHETDSDEEKGNVATGSEDENGSPASDPESDADSSSAEEQEALMNGFEDQASESDEEEEASEASFSADSASVSSSDASASQQSTSSADDEVSDDDDDDDTKHPSKRAIVACVLLRGRVESQPLNLEIAGPRQLRFWAHGKDTIHLTGHIEIEDMSEFDSDDEDDEDGMEMDYSGSESDGGIADYSASGSSSASDDEPLPPPPSQRRSVRITEIKEEENQDGMKVNETTTPPARSKSRSTSATAARGASGDVSASPSRSSEVKGSKSDQKGHRDNAVSPAPGKTEQSTPSSRGKKNQASAAHSEQTGDASTQSGKHVRFLSSADEKGTESAKKRARGDSSLASPAATQSPAGSSGGSAAAAAAAGNLPTGIACSKCGKSFKLASALEQHMKAKHAA